MKKIQPFPLLTLFVHPITRRKSVHIVYNMFSRYHYSIGMSIPIIGRKVSKPNSIVSIRSKSEGGLTFSSLSRFSCKADWSWWPPLNLSPASTTAINTRVRGPLGLYHGWWFGSTFKITQERRSGCVLMIAVITGINLANSRIATLFENRFGIFKWVVLTYNWLSNPCIRGVSW